MKCKSNFQLSTFNSQLLYKVSLILNFVFVYACNQEIKPESQHTNISKFKYAKHIQINNYDGYKLLIITDAYPGAPDYKYILKKSGTSIPDSLQSYQVINIPLKNIVVTSTTHLTPLKLLGLKNKLVGFPNTSYISDPEFRKLVKSGKIKELGSGSQINTEELLMLHPDLLMQFSSRAGQNNDETFIKNGIPVFYNADWMEQNPLGRAEWLKVFGILFNKEKSADSIFNQIETRYLKIKQKIDTVSQKPLVFQGGSFGDKWFVPGGRSYAAQLIKDAGGQYLWQDDTHNGSITLNFENVLLQLPKADVWLNPGMLISKKAITKEIPASKNFKSFKNNRIYTYNLTRGPGGGVLYFEESNTYPDRVLSDLFQIFHPAQTHSHLYYYRKILR